MRTQEKRKRGWKWRYFLFMAGISLIAFLVWPNVSTSLKRQFPNKTRWDYLEAIFIPVFPSTCAAFAIWWLNAKATERQERNEQYINENRAIAEYIKDITPLLLDKNLKEASKGSVTIAVARALTLATLTRLKSDQRAMQYSIVLRFLVDSGITNSGGLFDFPGMDLTEINLSGLRWSASGHFAPGSERTDLCNINLASAILARACLRYVDLNNAILEKTTLHDADLTCANLNRAWLANADLSHALLCECNLSDSFLSGADMNSVNLRGADLTRANLTQANLSKGILSNCKLNEAVLVEASLTKAILENSDLSHSILWSADLRGANLAGANLFNTDLHSITWDKNTLWPDHSTMSKAINIPNDLLNELDI